MRTTLTTKQADVLVKIATLKNQALTHKGKTSFDAAQRKDYRDEANDLAKTLPANVRTAFLSATADGPAALRDVLADHAEILPEEPVKLEGPNVRSGRTFTAADAKTIRNADGTVQGYIVKRVQPETEDAPEESAPEESTPEVTRYNGTRTDHLGFTKDYYTTTLRGVTYDVRRNVHPDHGTGHVIKSMDDYGETYSVHPGTDLGKSIIAKVLADTTA